jgi:hypothetical protein
MRRCVAPLTATRELKQRRQTCACLAQLRRLDWQLLLGANPRGDSSDDETNRCLCSRGRCSSRRCLRRTVGKLTGVRSGRPRSLRLRRRIERSPLLQHRRDEVGRVPVPRIGRWSWWERRCAHGRIRWCGSIHGGDRRFECGGRPVSFLRSGIGLCWLQLLRHDSCSGWYVSDGAKFRGCGRSLRGTG